MDNRINPFSHPYQQAKFRGRFRHNARLIVVDHLRATLSGMDVDELESQLFEDAKILDVIDGGTYYIERAGELYLMLLQDARLLADLRNYGMDEYMANTAHEDYPLRWNYEYGTYTQVVFPGYWNHYPTQHFGWHKRVGHQPKRRAFVLRLRKTQTSH